MPFFFFLVPWDLKKKFCVKEMSISVETTKLFKILSRIHMLLWMEVLQR